MESQRSDIQQAADYLHDNMELRAALSVAEGAALEPHPLGMGEHNLNYWFEAPAAEERYVLRVNVTPQPFHDNQVAYEYAALEALESSGCTPRPIYLDDSPGALGKGVIVESFCEGRQLDYDNLQPGDLDTAVRLMADVHAVPVSDECPLYRPADPLRELFEECLQRYEFYRRSAFEDARVTKWTERFIGLAKNALAETSACQADAHIINTETLPSHFLISDTLEGRGAFVDWERPIIGEVAQDVAFFVSPASTFWDSEWMCSASEAERIVEQYWRAVDGRFERAGFDERFRAYRALTALRSVTWFCRALVQYRQEGMHKTAKTVEKMPTFLSDDFMHLMEEYV